MRMTVAQARKAFPTAHIPKVKPRRRAPSKGEELFVLQLCEYQYEHLGVADFEREHQFLAIRRWRFDFAWPERKVAVEIEGVGGLSRHTTLKGYTGDCIKYATAAAYGWTVLRFTHAMVKNGSALDFTLTVLARHNP